MKTCFPARKANGGDYASLNEVMDRIEREPHGSWLAGTNRMWHGGIHLTEVTAPGAVLSESRADKTVPLQSMADGEIVAWRVNRDYLTADYCGQCVQYSSTFLLVKSVCKPDPDNAKSWLEFYVLYMGLAPLSAFPKSSRFRVTAQGDGVRLRRHTGYETTGQPVPEPTGDTLGKGAGVLILRRESFVLQGKEEPFGLARPLKDGKPHGASCWVSLRDGYLEEDGNAYDNLPDWMWQAVAQGIFDVVVNPGEPLRIAAGDAVGFLAEDIAPAGKCELAPSYFAHIEVLSVDPRMPDFLGNPGNVDAGTHYIRLGLHKPLYLRTGETFEAMSAITERDGGKLLERDKCHPAESGGKTYYQIRPHTWMCGDDVDEVRQFDLAERGFSALTENTVSDMKDSLKAGWMRDALMWFAERMNPEKGMRQGMMSRYYKGMVDKLDTDHDGMLSARELFAAVHHPEMGIRKLASRLVVKHDPEWFGGSAHHKWATFFQNYDVLRVDYAKKWLDDCEWMSQVPAFSSGAGVWHMHPVVFLDALALNHKLWVLGTTSEHYESGGKGPGVISSGRGDHGGVSYGCYQLSSKLGVVQQYVQQSKYKDKFSGLNSGTDEFNSVWKDIAEVYNKEFANDQHKFIKKTHYDAQVSFLAKYGIKITHKRAAIHDMIWSTSVQYGPYTDLIIKATKDISFDDSTDDQIIIAVQDYKYSHVETKFRSSPKLWAGLKSRATSEKTKLLALANDNAEIE